jgi:hypothetical protein
MRVMAEAVRGLDVRPTPARPRRRGDRGRGRAICSRMLVTNYDGHQQMDRHGSKAATVPFVWTEAVPMAIQRVPAPPFATGKAPAHGTPSLASRSRGRLPLETLPCDPGRAFLGAIRSPSRVSRLLKGRTYGLRCCGSVCARATAGISRKSLCDPTDKERGETLSMYCSPVSDGYRHIRSRLAATSGVALFFRERPANSLAHHGFFWTIR